MTNCCICCCVAVCSAIRNKKKKAAGPGDKKAAAAISKTETRKLDVDAASDVPEYVNITMLLLCPAQQINSTR